jgi:hypothetical protein
LKNFFFWDCSNLTLVGFEQSLISFYASGQGPVAQTLFHAGRKVTVRSSVTMLVRPCCLIVPEGYYPNKQNSQLGQLVYVGESWERLGYSDPRYKPPSVVSAPDPAITEEARRRGYGGTETVFLKLSEAGHASDYWVAWPLDYGLNPQAIAALKGYVFKPATLDG